MVPGVENSRYPGRGGEVHLARFEDYGLIKRLVLPSIAFTDENSQQHCVVW